MKIANSKRENKRKMGGIRRKQVIAAEPIKKLGKGVDSGGNL